MTTPPSMPPPPQYPGAQTPGDTSLPENANVELEVDGPTRQRRLTVFFRGLLLIPQYVVLFFLGIANLLVMFVGWFGALAMGRLPEWARQYLALYLRYSTRVNAYAYLLVDRYPSFSLEGDDYPVRLDMHSGRLNRAAVLFRFLLIIPAAIVSVVLSTGWLVCGFVLWLVVLIMGRTPAPVFGATASMLRYSVRQSAYFAMLTSAYPNPKSIFGERVVDSDQQEVPRGTRPLVLTRGAVALLIVFLVLGVLGQAADTAVQATMPPPEYQAAGLGG